ncbi:metallophosphoesterase [Curtobacterium flaccumfaciens]|uniref:metallophosphoesterase n=1 Tax=Curtobacterium flaccumfaciens TaxID=2035 RepID=UPI001BDEF494|nr:metallophosphoesterase [Curtobacterium flaccumfaciens]MBT1595674.1 metallophosphoesterase [Curtobacterium flaccumfaciens pv. flaccumfaciens]
MESQRLDRARSIESEVAVAGDWHGDLRHVPALLARVHLARPNVRTVLQLGDFGIGRQASPMFLDAIERMANTLDLRIFVTPGSYDDWGALHHAFATRPDRPMQLTEHVYALPRGLRFVLGGRSFLSFGGAAPTSSRNSALHAENVTPTSAEVERAAHGGQVDVLLLHEAVDEGVRQVDTKIRYEAARGRLSADTLEAARRSRALVSDLRNRVQPRVTLHAHMHIRGARRTPDATVVSLSRENRAGNIGFLHLPTLDFTWLEQATSDRTAHAH